VVRDELRPHGFEIVSVAMDTNGLAAAGPYIEAARPTYPVLIDVEHSLGALLGIVNVPMGVWIDEDGVLARPAEVCSAPIPRRDKFASLLENAAPRLREMIQEALNMDLDTETYAAALRDWARNGKKSRYALSPEEVVRRSAARPKEVSLAAASFELGQHLNPTTGPTSARRGPWSTRCRVQQSTTTATGSRISERSGRRTTIRSSRCERRREGPDAAPPLVAGPPRGAGGRRPFGLLVGT